MSTISQRWVSHDFYQRRQLITDTTAAPVDREVEDDGSIRHSASKHQAILSMDMNTWREIIDTFELKEPMIKHRKEATNSGPGARGWYS